MTPLGPLARAALRLVPARWRESVASDLAEEASLVARRAATRDLWIAWQILRVGGRFSARPRSHGPAIAGRVSWNLGMDVRLAVRAFQREPWAAFAVVGTLALGIGATTATYAVVNYALLRPVPGVVDGDRLISIYAQTDATTASRTGLPFPHFDAMRNATPALEGLAAWSAGDVPFALDKLLPPRTMSFVTVTRGFFEIVGVRPRHGRLFSREEYEGTGVDVAVISDRLWRREFNRDPSVVGRQVFLSGHPFQIIGVARDFEGFSRLQHQDGWLAQASRRTFDPAWTVRAAGYQYMFGRLAGGAAMSVAQEQLTAAYRSVGEYRIGNMTFAPYAFAGLTDGIGKASARIMSVFRVMLAGVGLLLLLACANAAHLMLARHLKRGEAFAVRHALGASRARLLRELLVEAGVIAGTSCMVGLGVAAVFTSMFRTTRLLTYMPVLDELSLDWRVAVFCCALSAITIFLFALVPALIASRAGVCVGSSGARTTRRTGALRSSLVGAQVALSFTLVVVAALLAQSVRGLQSTDFGFSPDAVLRFSFRPTRAGLDGAAVTDAMLRLKDRLSATPGVASVALAFWSPFYAGSGSSLRLPDQTDSQAIRIASHEVTGEYFAVLNIPVLLGRTFSPAESTATASDGAPIILNALLARQVFADAPAVGRTVMTLVGNTRQVVWQPRIVIGVVGSVVGTDVREGQKPFAYEPFGSSRIATVLVRPTGSFDATAALVRRAAGDVAPAIPVDEIVPLRADAEEQIAQERVLSRLSLIVGAIAALLALAGLYAAVAQYVGERTREFAIRTAIGATGAIVAGTILRRVAGVTIGGLLAGGALIGPVTGLLAAYLFGVSPRDPLTIALAALGLMAAAIAAAWPAIRRAVRIDPAHALRAN